MFGQPGAPQTLAARFTLHIFDVVRRGEVPVRHRSGTVSRKWPKRRNRMAQPSGLSLAANPKMPPAGFELVALSRDFLVLDGLRSAPGVARGRTSRHARGSVEFWTVMAPWGRSWKRP